ncbi:MAG: hypothetical protein IRY97_11855, partial [Thermomicrobiaceae bacterium]|nr:hypothetical protein [Thermomicrobiaceae bacterium]
LSLTVGAQGVALLDLFARPKDLLSDEAKMVWAMFLLIVGPLAFAPYWLLVARRPAPGAR